MLETTPDPRIGKRRHPNTVLGYLSSFGGVFTIAVQQFLIDTNPMDNVVVGSKIESKRRPYSVDQVILILTRAQAETDDIFLPLLVQAYSGCRVSEVVARSRTLPPALTSSILSRTRSRPSACCQRPD